MSVLNMENMSHLTRREYKELNNSVIEDSDDSKSKSDDFSIIEELKNFGVGVISSCGYCYFNG